MTTGTPAAPAVLPLLDADVLIDLDRKHPPAVAWLHSLPTTPPASGIAAMELLAGCSNNQERARIEKLLALFTLLWPDVPAMEQARKAMAALHLSHNLGVLDALIAATAVQRSMALATFNVKHFAAVPGLTTVQPYAK